MSSMILTAVIVLGITGLILAVVLFFISKKFAVEEDPRVVQINEILPGANCGGCGYPGCSAFAENCVKKGSLKGMRCSAASGEVMQQIAEILGEEPEMIEEALLELIMDYASREGALEIDDENGYILQVKQEHLDIVEKLCPVELRPPVLKTLTVIALKEPIRQSYLKDLRGSNAYDHVAELLEKGLISRHKDKNGRSYNIKTTSKFNEYFKLKGDVRSLVKTLNIDAGVKDDPTESVLEDNSLELSGEINEE